MPIKPWNRNVGIAMILIASYIVGMFAAYGTTELVRSFRTSANNSPISDSTTNSEVAERI